MEHLKQIETYVSSDVETRTSQTINGVNLSYTKCERSPAVPATDGWKSNYFKSFNLPYQADQLVSGFTGTGLLAANKPHLYQLNVDSIVICPIPPSYYNEVIDGRTIEMEIPQHGVGAISAKTVVSSTYNTLTKKQNSELLGDNIAFLFSDDLNTPFQGTTNGGNVSHAANTTWEVSSYINRPPAVAFDQLETVDYASDTRAWDGVSLAVNIINGYPTINYLGKGYNYDIPVGFAVLDKGYIVLTHTGITENIPWTAGTQMHYDGDGSGVAGGSNFSAAAEQYICFTGTTGTTSSTVTLTDLNTEYKTNVVCLAMPGEFYISTNNTWEYAVNYQTYVDGDTNFDSIYISEIGLYNTNSELVAVAKLDVPTEKRYTSILNFNLEINM